MIVTRPLAKFSCSAGFTLIELSIVLVIIGLTIGGVLFGQDLISSAAVRAQISQIAKYNTVVNAFRGKYGYLPGDIPDPYATQFGFQSRGSYKGEGDGNGIIEGNFYGATQSLYYSGSTQSGEPLVFWVDLSTANMIDGGFNSATPQATETCTKLSSCYPAAKIGNGNYVAVWSLTNINYFSVVAITCLHSAYSGIFIESNCAALAGIMPGPTVQQAYNIDIKIDDGMPQTGRVVAVAPYDRGWQWAGIQPVYALSSAIAPYTTATAGSSATCFDNSFGSGPQQYSLAQSSGAGSNCPISIQMQGAAR